MRHGLWGFTCRRAILLAAVALVVVVPSLSKAAPPPQTARFSVDVGGHGLGKITIKIPGEPDVECPNACLRTVPVGTHVTLHATPDATTSYFAGYGPPCVGSNDCEVLVGGATRIAATFQEQPTITIGLQGLGSGTVTIVHLGKREQCDDASSSVCSVQVPPGTTVTLSGTAAAGSAFVGFGEPCAGTPEACGVLVSKSLKVSATFRKSSSSGADG